MKVLQYIVDMGPTVMLPLIIFLFGILLRTKVSTAIRAGLTVGIGFVGVNLVIGLLMDSLGPASKDMVSRLGIDLSVIDVGWPATAAVAFGSSVGALAIPIGIAVNIILLLIGLTKTLNIDLWNLWHCAFTGALVTAITGSYTMGITTTVVHTIVILVLSDMSAKYVKDYYGYDNLTFTHGTSTPYLLIALPLEKLFNVLPGIKNLKADPDAIQKRMGIFGESTVLGLILGIAVGALAGWNLQEILQLGVKMAAVMLLLPRVVAILMEGLAPISEAASEFVKKRFPGRELYIGLDSALAVGHPAVIASSLLLIPIALGLAALIPGNKVLPFGDLVTIPFIICLMVPIFRGNVVRTILAGSIAIGFGLLIATYVSPFFTEAAINAGFKLPAGATTISSLVDGSVPTTAIFVFASKFGYIGLGIVGFIALIAAYILKRKDKQIANNRNKNLSA